MSNISHKINLDTWKMAQIEANGTWYTLAMENNHPAETQGECMETAPCLKSSHIECYSIYWVNLAAILNFFSGSKCVYAGRFYAS